MFLKTQSKSQSLHSAADGSGCAGSNYLLAAPRSLLKPSLSAAHSPTLPSLEHFAQQHELGQILGGACDTSEGSGRKASWEMDTGLNKKGGRWVTKRQSQSVTLCDVPGKTEIAANQESRLET